MALRRFIAARSSELSRIGKAVSSTTFLNAAPLRILNLGLSAPVGSACCSWSAASARRSAVTASQPCRTLRGANSRTTAPSRGAFRPFTTRGTLSSGEGAGKAVGDAGKAVQQAPTGRQLRVHALNAAIPMIGFGFMDNLVMIQAGDLIDTTLGVKLGLTTMTAAACGQIVSDFCGVTFGGTVEAIAQKLGLPVSGLSARQLESSRVRYISTGAAAVGVVIGCCLGMVSLLFMDLDKAERLKQQKELATLFSALMEKPAELLGCEYCTLWMLHGDGKHIWSKIHTGTIPDQESLKKTFDLYDKDGSGLIDAAELHEALAKLGWMIQLEEIAILIQKVDVDGNKELDFEEFNEFMKAVLLNEEVLVPLDGLKKDVIESAEVVNLADAHDDPRFNRDADKYTGYRTRGLLMVPIVDGKTGEVYGLVEMANKKVADKVCGFSDDDVTIIKVLAAHAAIFIRKCHE